MSRSSLSFRLRAMAAALTPGLRVVGLTYTGLGAMLATLLVIGVALVPVAPALRLAAEPAQEAVTKLVLPAHDVVTSVFSRGPVHVEPPEVVAPSHAVLAAPVQVSAAAVAAEVVSQSLADEALSVTPAPENTLIAMQTVARRSAAEPLAIAAVMDEMAEAEPTEVAAPEPDDTLATSPPPATELQIAAQEAPHSLPVTAVPTETRQQTKSRLNAENQAAIDAAKAAQTHARIDAAAANEAAIAARKAAATPVPAARPASTPTTVPTPRSAAVPTRQSSAKPPLTPVPTRPAVRSSTPPPQKPGGATAPPTHTALLPAAIAPTAPTVSVEGVAHSVAGPVDEATLEEAPRDQADGASDSGSL